MSLGKPIRDPVHKNDCHADIGRELGKKSDLLWALRSFRHSKKEYIKHVNKCREDFKRGTKNCFWRFEEWPSHLSK